jgi:hypothetical protein
VRRSLDLDRTLFVISSKSGTTIETRSHFAHFWERYPKGASYVAITDPGTPLEELGAEHGFRRVFRNPPDIGGRYSALTYVGLVPASLIGLDLDAILASAASMLGACRNPDPEANPGLSLGLAIGTLARSGRDKLTFLIDEEIGAFGAWLEQLIAESTGKHGVGIVPVDLEPLGAVDRYGPDRAFVRIALAGSADGGRDALAAAVEAAGHPVIRIELTDPIDLGGEFVRWEIATAFAGAILGIDPFDQPNVEEAKELTRQVLASVSAGRPGAATEVPEPIAVGEGLALHGDAPLRLTASDGDVVGELARHLARRRPDAYLAIQAFIAPTEARDAAFTHACAGNGARPEAATAAGCNGHAAASKAATAAGCNGHAATSKAATTARCNGTTATASKATATANSCAAATAGPGTAATTTTALLRLSGAKAWRDHRHKQRHRCRSTQNFQIDHCWLHLRDIVLTRSAGGRSRARVLIARKPNLSDRNCMRNERIAPIPRHAEARSGHAKYWCAKAAVQGCNTRLQYQPLSGQSAAPVASERHDISNRPSSHEAVSAEIFHLVERPDVRHAIVDVAIRRAGRPG